MLKHKDPAKDFRLFGFIWLATIFIFFVFISLFINQQIDFSTSTHPLSNFILIIFLLDILVGTIAFPFIILNGFRYLRSKPIKFSSYKINRWIKPFPIMAILLLVFILSMGTVLVKSDLVTINLNGSNKAVNTTLAPTSEPTLIISSADPNPTTRPAPKPTQKPVYVDPDPIIDCKSSYGKCLRQSIKVRRSACNNITCCQIGDKWSVYPTSDKCKQDQDTYWKVYYSATGSTYKPPTTNWDPNKEYTNCGFIDTNTNQMQYLYITYSECSKRQNEGLAKINEVSKKSLEESQQKLRDQEAASQYQETLNKACTQVQSDWYDYKVEFYATEYNNFSSSAEAVRELSRRRDIYQSEANKAGCNIYLSM